jgi:hypothetical protein
MAEWLLVAIALGAAVFFTAPPPGQYDPALWRIALHKAMLVATGGWLAYGLDRSIYPYARPDVFLVGGRELVFSAAMLRRAIIIAAGMLAMAMGA